jgi:hypothetical protein
VDYKDTFAPVTKYTSIRALTSLVSFMGWRIHQMDVKTTFLNGIIKEVGRNPMCAGLRKPYMDSSRHREHGILGSMDIYRV